jgi:hypothetical protein
MPTWCQCGQTAPALIGPKVPLVGVARAVSGRLPLLGPPTTGPKVHTCGSPRGAGPRCCPTGSGRAPRVTGAGLQARPAWILARMTSRIPADRVCRGPRLA